MGGPPFFGGGIATDDDSPVVVAMGQLRGWQQQRRIRGIGFEVGGIGCMKQLFDVVRLNFCGKQLPLCWLSQNAYAANVKSNGYIILD